MNFENLIFECEKNLLHIERVNNISLEIEPGHLANGPYHVGAAMNNLAYFHRWYEPRTRTIIKGGELRREKDYFSSIKKLAVNSYWAAALTDGKCYLHPIEQQNGGQDLEKLLFGSLILLIFSLGVSQILKMKNQLLIWLYLKSS